MVFGVEDAQMRRMASGICRYAMPKMGYVTREFIVSRESQELPEQFYSWKPEAAISFLSSGRENLLQAIALGRRPVVNMARCSPAPGRAVVLGDAEEVYNVAQACFQKLGLDHVEQYVLGGGAAGNELRERYQRYTMVRKLPFHSYTTEEDPANIYQWDRIRKVDKPLADWLRKLPKPAGIFTQNSYAGPFLCHCCRLLRINVPKELAIIGCDDFDVAMASDPPLTTIRIPAEEIGNKAAQIAIAMLQGNPAPKEAVLVPGIKLIRRRSTGHVAKKGSDIDGALQFIRDHACEGIKVNDVVAHTQGVSRMTFHKRFVEAAGTTPAKAIHEQKIRAARRLLSETKLSIGTIAGMCGYFDELYFSQCFRKSEGVAPRVYRRINFAQ